MWDDSYCRWYDWYECAPEFELVGDSDFWDTYYDEQN